MYYILALDPDGAACTLSVDNLLHNASKVEASKVQKFGTFKSAERAAKQFQNTNYTAHICIL